LGNLAEEAAGNEFTEEEIAPEVIRTPEEVLRLREKITLIARVFSRQYDLNVLPSEKGWSCGMGEQANEVIEDYLTGKLENLDGVDPEVFQPTNILYDKRELATEEEAAVLGVLRHEVGHANNSDFKLLVEGQKISLDEGYLPSSWVNIANALEDPWVNNLEIAGSKTVQEQMTQRYEKSTPEIIAKINSQPLTRQLSLNIIHHWLKGENIPTLENERVLEIFEKIKPKVEQFFNSRSAQENFELLRDEIWDEYKVLESKATEDELLKELMRQIAPGVGPGEGGEQQELPEGFLSKIRKKLEKKPKLDKEIEKHLPGGLRGQVESELAKQAQEQIDQDQELVEGGSETGSLSPDVDLTALSPELIEELQKVINNLSPEVKAALDQKARENLDQKQSEALNRELPRFLKMKRDKKTGQYQTEIDQADNQEVESAKAEVEQFQKEEDQRKEEQEGEQEELDEEERKRQEEEIRAQKEEREMRELGFAPGEAENFRRFKRLESSMRPVIENFTRVLYRYLPKKETYEYGGEFYSGSQIDFDKISRKVPIGDYRIFKRRETVESTEAKMYVTLLIDNSGSMAGEKMEESLKTTIFFARVLKRFEIPFAVKFFGDHVEDVKNFDDDYDNPRTRIKPKLVELSDASGGSTNLSDPLEESFEEMTGARRKFPESFGAIFVISDGGANSGLTGEALKNLIRENQKGMIIQGFGLGAEGQALSGYFGEKNFVNPETFKKLPTAAFRILRVTLQRILKLSQ